MTQQRASLGGSEPGYRLQHGFVVPASATPAMPGDGKAMGLIANALNHAQSL
jgi:hypothetical protein